MSLHLVTAQQAIARQDYSTAIDSFTRLIKENTHAQLQIPLLSRAICYSQIKDHRHCIVDCERVLTMEDCVSPNELLPGCYSTRIAAMTLLGQAHDKLGNKEERDKYRKMATESLKKQGVQFEKATHLKDKGNEIYRTGDYEGALAIYKEAFKIDSSSSVIASNICQCLMNLKRHLEAEEYADQCVKLAPTWGKAWYRKGMVCLKRHAYMEATSAFQTGLKHDPENANLKSLYVEASKLAEKHSKGGFDKKMMVMLMDLKRESWKVAEWTKKQDKLLGYVPSGSPSALDIQEDWNNRFRQFLEKDQVKRDIERIVKYKHPDYKKATPLVPKYDLDDMRSFIMVESPLVSLLLFYKLLSLTATQEDDWYMVWSFQINKKIIENPLFVNDAKNEEKQSKTFNFLYSSALYPYLVTHGCYAALVNKKKNVVLDFLHLWSILEANDHDMKPNVSFHQGYWFKSLLVGWNEGLPLNENIYACKDEKKFEEFLERFLTEDVAPSTPAPRTSVFTNHDLSSPPPSPIQQEAIDEEEEPLETTMQVKSNWIDAGGLLTQISGFVVALLSLVVYLYLTGFGSD